MERLSFFLFILVALYLIRKLKRAIMNIVISVGIVLVVLCLLTGMNISDILSIADFF